MTVSPSLLLAALALVSAILALTRPNAVHALLWMLASLLALAGAFFALGAGLAGAVQILVYAGAILVVFLFVVLTLDLMPQAITREKAGLSTFPLIPLLAAALVIIPIVTGLIRDTLAETAATDVPAHSVGALLFGPWAVAVELASFLLLVGIVGARQLGRREKGQ